MNRRFPDPEWQVFDPRGRRKYLTGAERVRFMTAADRLAPARRAFCYLLTESGCRLSEAVQLAAHQVNADEGRITFLTLKQRRPGITRQVPIPDEVIAMLTALPVSRAGLLWSMNRSTGYRLVKEVMDISGIRGVMACPKGLRHGFGMNAAECKEPPNLIQKWMGHRSRFTTGICLDAVGVEERQFASRMWRRTEGTS